MKRLAYIAALLAAGSAGYVADQTTDLPRVLPQAEAPKAATVKVRGPSQGLTGAEYVFVAEVTGDCGRVRWIVTPPCDLSVSTDGRLARLRCDEPGDYAVIAAAAGIGGDVADDATSLHVVDVDAEIETALAAATEVAAPPVPTLADRVLSLPNLPSDHERRKQAASVFQLMAGRLRNGLVPSDSDPLRLIQGQLGEDARAFLDDLSGVADELRLTGEITTAASFADLCEQVAVALSQ